MKHLQAVPDLPEPQRLNLIVEPEFVEQIGEALELMDDLKEMREVHRYAKQKRISFSAAVIELVHRGLLP